MIADRLPEDSKHKVGGSVEVNGVNRKNDNIYWSVSFDDTHEVLCLELINCEYILVHDQSSSSSYKNIVSYVDQIDRLHGFLTVKETIDFAYQCCYG